MASLKKYDVFISFRGEDTRDNFTSHLHADLGRKGIETYIDYRIPKGDDVWTELVRAIKDSALFLVIFSENYASSTWCLNELLEIMELKKTGQADVIPVFYRIDPSQVRKQTGSYQKAFLKHDNHPKQSQLKIQQWKDALSEAANLSGFHSHQYRNESDLIQGITGTILQKPNHKNRHELTRLFIFDENYTDVESLLKIKSKEVRIIGIWGMGGIGKTTLATAIFQKFSSQYDATCFLKNVAEDSERHVCNKLLFDLLGEELHIDTTEIINSNVAKRLRHKKVFIALDGVNNSQLLEILVGEGRKWLGAGSRVIVTTRDRQVLISRGVEEIHEVKKMSLQNSLKLFSLNAFGQNFPTKGYLELSKKVVAYAQGVPLALEVLGSYLRSKREKEWNSALDKLKKIPNVEIQKVLRLSFDELDDKDKNIFLDIACFFKGHEKDEVIKILDACGFFADIGIRNLINKSLVSIGLDHRIEMHNLIQEMGREIVCEESKKYPGRRSRLWDSEDVCDVLTKNKGTETVEGILLDMTQIPNINLSSKVFKSMPNLRILVFQALNTDSKRINSVYLPKGLDLLPNNLRYFLWDGYPLKSLPSNFCPEKLVELSLIDNNMEKLWHGVQNLPNLEKIDLTLCTRLKECPNLSQAPNLKRVVLWRCRSLVHVDSSILSLPKLEYFGVAGCKSLKSLCGRICSPSFRSLDASYCFNLQEFSVLTDISPSPHFDLELDGIMLDEMLRSIFRMTNIDMFGFPICEGLKDLPENFTVVWLFESTRAQQEETLITLTKVLSGSGFQRVTRLGFSNCHRLSRLPANISLLSSLESLFLLKCDILSLPESIKYLPRLKRLAVEECSLLRSIPELPLSIQQLHVWNCDSLEIIVLSSSNKSSQIHHDFTFGLFNCIKLDQHSYDAILKNAMERIELGAKFYVLPYRRDQVRNTFHYHSTQALFTVELPPNLLGVVFYLVLSSQASKSCQYVGCKCFLETNTDKRIYLTKGFFTKDIFSSVSDVEMTSDHVFIRYDADWCKQVMEAIKETGNLCKSKCNFEFFTEGVESGENVIKECGLGWIYPLKDQIVDKGTRYKSKRSRELRELEDSAFQNGGEGSKHDEKEETLPSAKKFKRGIFETSSNHVEVEETELLRHLIEEKLHI